MLLLCLLFWLPFAQAGELRLGQQTDWPLGLTPYLDVLKDPDAQLDLAGVRSRASDFVPATTDLLRPGFTRSAWWLRLSVVNDRPLPQSLRLMFLSPRLADVTFHVEQDGHWSQTRAGLAVPNSEQHWSYAPERMPGLSLELAAHQRAQIWIRVKSPTSIGMDAVLTTPGTLHASGSLEALLDGINLGGLVVLCIYSLFLCLFSRDWLFGLQGVTCAVFLLYEASYRGYAKQYLWPEVTAWGYQANACLGALTATFIIAYLYFLCRREKISLPWASVFIGTAMLFVGIALMSLFGDYYLIAKISIYTPLVTSMLLVAVGLLFIKRMPGTAWLVISFFMVSVVGILIRALELGGSTRRWLPDINYTPLVAIVIMAFMLAILAAWVNRMRAERAEAQALLLSWHIQEKDRLQKEVDRQTSALNQALAEARTAHDDQTRILAYISHDLRAPLVTIGGYARLLQDGSPPELASHARTIAHSASYQLGLIDELLEYAKGELHPLSIDAAPLRLPDLINHISQYAHILAAQQHNTFILDYADDIPDTLMLDGYRLQQVLLNLLSNAAKFTHDGEIRLRVGIEYDNGEPHLGISVSDTGVGIPSEKQAHIFEAFAQLQRNHGGAGLGLFISRRIIQYMGGTLALHSTPDQGSQFHFAIPCRTADSSARTMQIDLPPPPAMPAVPPALACSAARAAAARTGADGRGRPDHRYRGLDRADDPQLSGSAPLCRSGSRRTGRAGFCGSPGTGRSHTGGWKRAKRCPHGAGMNPEEATQGMGNSVFLL
ncbi:sensor histidine kinase [Microvirgula aerodenitrificans]|uniref:sensor histidine kinase n=1 Tax=Microvirgula aerodenitrificans TaxID=57480 RepID=UPI002F3E4A87